MPIKTRGGGRPHLPDIPGMILAPDWLAMRVGNQPRRVHQYSLFAVLGLVSSVQVALVSRWVANHIGRSTIQVSAGAEEVRPSLQDLGALPTPAQSPPQSPVDRGARDISFNPNAVPSCPGGSRLTIASAGRDVSSSLAVLSANPSAQGELVRKGDRFAGGRVWHIGSDRVWVMKNGELCQIRMYEPPISLHRTEPSGSAAPAGEFASSIRRRSPTEVDVDRSFLDRVLENPMKMLRARLVPVTEQGRAVGFQVYGIRPDTLLAAIGLVDGDRLHSINGFGITDVQSAMVAFARLRLERQLKVRVVRGGKDVNLDINVI